MEETDDAGPSQRSPRTVHTFAVWAATRFVPTGELRRERSFRVGACGRRPLESADPGGSASWALYRASIACTVEKKLYGGRGLGLVRCPHVPILAFQMGGFTVGKCRISLRGRFRSPIEVQRGFRRSPGELLRAPGRPKVVKMGPILDQFELQGSQK